MGMDVLYFDHVGLFQQLGREGMSQRLREVARTEKPDVLFLHSLCGTIRPHA